MLWYRRQASRVVNILISLVLGGSVVGFTTVQARAATLDCQVTDKLVNPCHPWLGARSMAHTKAASDLKSQLLYHEQLIGRQVDVVHDYARAGDVLSANDVYFASRANTTLFENWKPAGNWADAGGGNATVNANIDKMAASVKALGSKQIFMTIWHEPENDLGSDANCPGTTFKGAAANTPAAYKAMWQNVQNRFTADGVSNVVWAMDYMNYPAWQCVVPDLYPGDNLVDWIVFNGYWQSGATWDSTISRFYDWLTANSSGNHNYVSKLWGIVEWGIANSTQPQAYSYYDQVKAALDANTFPKLDMYMVFDALGPGGNTAGGHLIDLTSSGVYDQTEVNHYKALANDPVFTNTIPPLPTDTTPPVARIDGPTDQSTVSGVVNISGIATDDVSVASVSLLVDGIAGPQLSMDASGNVTAAWDTTTVANGQHTLILTAVDSSGNSGQSTPVSVTVNNPDVTAPSAPTDVQGVPAGSGSIDLSWAASTDNVGVAGYNVYRDGSLISSVAGDAATYTDSGLSDTTLYQYSVTAVDAAGNESLQSDPTTVMITDIIAPTAPTGLTAIAGAGQVTLNWQASSDNVGVTAYDVLRDGTVIGTVDGGTTTYIDSTVSQSQTYVYAIAARDAAGNTSAASDTQSVTTTDTTPPSVPQSLLVSNNGTDVSLSWQASTDNIGVTGYNILRDGAVIATTTETTYTDSTGVQGQTYLYTVQAFDAAGNTSDASLSQTCSVPDVTPPTAPGKPDVKLNYSQTGVVVNWTAATDNVGVTHCAVWRNGSYVTRVSGTTLSYTDTDVKPGTAYSYTIYAVDAAENRGSASPASASIQVPDTTAPTAPTGLTATSPTAKTVKLAWKASSDNVKVTSYEIYRGTTKIATVSGTTLAYTVTGLASGGTYKFSVQASDAAGNASPMSTQVSIKVK